MNNTALKNQPTWLEDFVSVYQQLTKHNLHLLAEIYHHDIAFEDPMHKIDGLDNLSAYFTNLYENLSYCRFDVYQSILNDNQAAIYWQMVFSHKKLKGGEKITVEGHSLLYAHHDKVIFHRDYFDAGSMLYEHVPLLGGMIRFLKGRLAQ